MKEKPSLNNGVVHAKGSGFAKKKEPDLQLQSNLDKSFGLDVKHVSMEEKELEYNELQEDLKNGLLRSDGPAERIIMERVQQLEGEIGPNRFPGSVDLTKETIQDEMKRLQEEFQINMKRLQDELEETNRKAVKRTRKSIPAVPTDSVPTDNEGAPEPKLDAPTQEETAPVLDTPDTSVSEDGNNSKYWEMQDPASEKYLCASCGNAMGKSKFCSNCGTERPKSKPPVDTTNERIPVAGDETLPLETRRPETPPTPDEPPVHLEVPGTEPIPEMTPPELHDVPPDPEQMEPAPEVKQTIEVKDAQKLRAMYEAADKEEQKKPRWGWLKERMKGVITAGWWDSHVAETFRTGTKGASKYTEQGMKQIRSIAEGSVTKDLLEVKRQRIAELKQRLAYSEIQLAKYIAEAENPEISKHAQPENVIRELGNEVDNIKKEIEKREKELTDLEEQRKRQNQEVIRSLTLHGIEGFEHYVLTLSEMAEGPTKQRAIENLTGIVGILDGVEERLRADLGKRRGGLLKKIFGEQDKTYRGAELLTDEKLSRVKRDIFERCIAIQQGQLANDAESVKTIIRKNLDPEWWKRYVATAVEAALWGIGAKFILGQINTNYGALSVDSFPPIPNVPGAEQIGMHKTVWATTKKYLLEKCGIPNPTDAQVMNACKTVLQQNGLYEQAWQFVQGAKSSRVLPEGFKLLFSKAWFV